MQSISASISEHQLVFIYTEHDCYCSNHCLLFTWSVNTSLHLRIPSLIAHTELPVYRVIHTELYSSHTVSVFILTSSGPRSCSERSTSSPDTASDAENPEERLLQSEYRHSVHMVYIQCTYGAHTVHIPCTYGVHTVHIQCTYSVHTVHSHRNMIMSF